MMILTDTGKKNKWTISTPFNTTQQNWTPYSTHHQPSTICILLCINKKSPQRFWSTIELENALFTYDAKNKNESFPKYKPRYSILMMLVAVVKKMVAELEKKSIHFLVCFFLSINVYFEWLNWTLRYGNKSYEAEVAAALLDMLEWVNSFVCVCVCVFKVLKDVIIYWIQNK